MSDDEWNKIVQANLKEYETEQRDRRTKVANQQLFIKEELTK